MSTIKKRIQKAVMLNFIAADQTITIQGNGDYSDALTEHKQEMIVKVLERHIFTVKEAKPIVNRIKNEKWSKDLENLMNAFMQMEFPVRIPDNLLYLLDDGEPF